MSQSKKVSGKSANVSQKGSTAKATNKAGNAAKGTPSRPSGGGSKPKATSKQKQQPRKKETEKQQQKPNDTKKRGLVFNEEFAMITLKECRHVARIDAPQVSTDVTRYVSANAPTYFLLCNTWLLQIAELSEEGAYDLRDAITRVGLLAVINECQAVANEVLSTQLTIKDAAFFHFNGETPLWLSLIISCSEDIRVVLQLLRYPKRFSPSFADKVREKGISQFLNVNSRCGELRGEFTCETPQRHLARKIRPYIEDMCRGFRVDYDRDGFFSNGVAADAGKPLSEKLNAYSAYVPYLSTPLYPLGYGGTREPEYYGKNRYPKYISKVQAVPKSYKTPRIIAMEDAYRQFHMQAIRMGLERCIEANGFDQYLTLHDQQPNRDLCRDGAVDGTYCTIDLSSASDSLNRTLVWNLFPFEVYAEMTKYLPTHFEIEAEGRMSTRKMHMFCTSGSALTFPVESMVFLGIALYATDLVSIYTEQEIGKPHVFGDDMVVDSRAFATMCDMLTTLGFIVNTEKSFDGRTEYRESCGVEYLGGWDTSTQYFPRATFNWEKPVEQLSSIISLEHKFVGSWKIRRFLCDMVRKIEPRMTSSEIGAECADLWEPVPVFQKVCAPGSTTLSPETTRERHLAPKSVYKDNLAMVLQPSGLSNCQLADLWLYYKWLQSGPMYDDGLMETLGIPSKSPIRRSLTNVSTIRWDYITI